jgi:pimeloyl-ACP methyl ester carboxylesterase
MSLSAALPKISTNVRFTASALLFPELAGAWAERLFLTPPRAQMTETALDLIDARAAWLIHKGRRIATWEWGWKSHEAPAILLAHGWGGHAAQLRAFVFPLLAAGYRVIGFDQPAHGLSEGRLTGLPDLADVLSEVAWSYGRPRALIAHSVGAAAAAFAMTRGLKFDRVVLISPPSDFVGYSRRFARWHWIPEPVRRSMQAAIEDRYGVRWEELDLERIGPRLSAGALIIHDRDDRVVPLSHGARVARAWPHARLMQTRGLGHGRILRDPDIAQAAADFVTRRSVVAP